MTSPFGFKITLVTEPTTHQAYALRTKVGLFYIPMTTQQQTTSLKDAKTNVELTEYAGQHISGLKKACVE